MRCVVVFLLYGLHDNAGFNAHRLAYVKKGFEGRFSGAPFDCAQRWGTFDMGKVETSAADGMASICEMDASQSYGIISPSIITKCCRESKVGKL